MFIGHFGAGMGAKIIDKRPSLGTLFLASQFIDLLWPLLILIGIEQVEIDPGNTAFTPLNFSYYPFSHGFLSVLIWGILFGIIYYAFKKNLRASLLLGFLVLSHWLLDLIVHRPDLPVIPGSEFKAGFGLWNSVLLTIIIEGGIFIAGILIYLKRSRTKNKSGMYGFWGLIIFLVIIYIMNITSPPPPSSEAIGYVGLSQWLIIIWAYWVDKNRIFEKQEQL